MGFNSGFKGLSFKVSVLFSPEEMSRTLSNRIYITVFKTARHCSLSWSKLIKPTNFLRLALPSSLFPLPFASQFCIIPMLSPILLQHPCTLWRRAQRLKVISSVCKFPPSAMHWTVMSLLLNYTWQHAGHVQTYEKLPVLISLRSVTLVDPGVYLTS